MLEPLSREHGTAIARTALGAIDVGPGPTDEQLRLLSAIVQQFWGLTEVDVRTLSPLPVGECADAVPEELRKQARGLMIILELCRHPLDRAQQERVEEYAFALGGDGPGLSLVRALINGGTQVAAADYLRHFETDFAPGAEPVTDAVRAVAPILAEPDLVGLEARIRAQAPGTLGAAFTAFYETHTFPFPGEGVEHATTLVPHDMCHIVADYDATAEGEIALGAMKLAVSDDEYHWFEFLGNLAIHEACIFNTLGYGQTEPTLARPGVIDMVVGAMNRGRATARDFSRADFLGMLDWPLADVREEYGIPPL
ncbi:MAG: hypothetical protein ACKO1Y_01180 [Actinomycetota bacterium]